MRRRSCKSRRAASLRGVVYRPKRGRTPRWGGADEAANLDGNVVYVTHPRTEPTATNGAFDDILQWQTVATVFQNMTNMGILK